MSANHRFCSVLVIILIVSASCGGPQSPPPREIVTGPVLTWGTLDSFDFNVVEAEPGLVIPAKHLYERLYFSRAAAVGGWVDDSAITFFRDSLLIDTLISLTADSYDLPAHWRLHREYLRRANIALSQAYWAKMVSGKIAIDSQLVVEYYEANPDLFTLPEQADMYHIMSSYLGFYQTSDSALIRSWSGVAVNAFREEYIHNLHQLLKYGEAFENVAYNYSHDFMSNQAGGHLGWTTRQKYLEPFDSVAFALADGEFSAPYRDPDGWHILYRAAHVPGGPQPLEKGWVREAAEQGVFNNEVARLSSIIIAGLQGDAKIEENPRILTDTIIYDFPDSAWVAVINETDTLVVADLHSLEEDFRRGYRVSNSTPEMRSKMILQAALAVRILQQARADGVDTLPEYREKSQLIWDETVKSYLISDLYTLDDWSPTDSAEAAYYDAHYDEFNPTDHLKAHQLIIKDLELANFLREQINLGLDLEYLSKYYGAEGYQVEFEDIGIVRVDEVDSAMYHALMATGAYRATRIVETRRGYQIGKVIEREYAQSFEMVRTKIRSILSEKRKWERWAEIRDELFKKQKVLFPGVIPRFELPRLSDRNHPRTLPAATHGGHP